MYVCMYVFQALLGGFCLGQWLDQNWSQVDLCLEGGSIAYELLSGKFTLHLYLLRSLSTYNEDNDSCSI